MRRSYNWQTARSLSTMWDPEVEVGSPGLGASALTFHVISLDPRLIFLTKLID